MYGRGTFDMKGGIAAMMVAATRATAGGRLRGDVLLACVADEEYGSSGTEEVLESFTADAAVVTEPSHLEVTLAHKGFVWFDVEIEGRAAHGSRPELGIDAIAKAGHFLVALEQLGQRLADGPRTPCWAPAPSTRPSSGAARNPPPIPRTAASPWSAGPYPVRAPTVSSGNWPGSSTV